MIEEFVEGISLSDYCYEQKLTLAELVEFQLQLCEAVRLLHQCEPPIIHRDIKPKNLIVTASRTLVLIDFDASREFRNDKQEDTRRLGTVEYAPPEQFGYSQTDIRSDIYAMGVVFYEMLYGKRFVKFNNGQAQEKGKPVISVTPAQEKYLSEMINKCTMFDPQNRYASVDEIIDFLMKLKQTNRSVSIKWKKTVHFLVDFAMLVLIVILIAKFATTGNPVNDALQEQTPIPTAGAEQTGEPDEKFTAVNSLPTGEPNQDERLVQDTQKQELPKGSGQTSDPGQDVINQKPSATPTPIETVQIDYQKELDALGSMGEKTSHFYPSTDQELYLYSFDFEDEAVKSITCYSADGKYSYRINDKEYTLIGPVVQINREFLCQLEPRVYVFDAYTSLTSLYSFVIIVHDETEEYEPINPSAFSMRVKYNINEDENYTVIINNIGNRKIKWLLTNGETVDSNEYSTNLNDTGIIFTRDFIKKHCKNKENTFEVWLDDGYCCRVILEIVEKTLIPPTMYGNEFTYSKSSKQDFKVVFDWNDYPEVLYVATDNKGSTIEQDYVEITEDAVVIRYEYLSRLENGSYYWMVEFGDYGYTFHITIEE